MSTPQKGASAAQTPIKTPVTPKYPKKEQSSPIKKYLPLAIILVIAILGALILKKKTDDKKFLIIYAAVALVIFVLASFKLLKKQKTD
ncbi:hypothetical protein GPJ56_004685 [Histomonas meleagridis]|uniref:uncharacterized protein n=1 Tax=Histomonas meleagridis TaxID=135588 RepID=UPI003559789D|nr:hypothetical protein GPJ56_004685 [Histomonas meleagridis]KAH0797446.1 hypothetical protein GO595_009767 [Histomonas meleagridis]